MDNHKPFNVLVTSVSRKIPLVREVRKALEKFSPGSRIIGADCDAGCVGSYFVDAFWEMPLQEDLSVEELTDYCLKHQISAIIPTRDGELEFFANAKPVLKEHGILVMTSSDKGIQVCLDKLLFYESLKDHQEINVIYTATEPNPASSKRWVVKERFGSGSRNIRLDLTATNALSAGSMLSNAVYQPYIKGREFSTDLYVSDACHEVGAVVRSRDLIVSGESQVTTTVEMPRIEEMCLAAASLLDLTSHLVFQVIVDSEENIHVVECNCRFGGASPLSVAAGLDSFYWFFLECAGEDLSQITFNRSAHQLRQVRYPADKIVQIDE